MSLGMAKEILMYHDRVPAEIGARIMRALEVVPSSESWPIVVAAAEFYVAGCKSMANVCREQHAAIDTLFATLVGKDKDFFPSRSGQPWAACVLGNATIKAVEEIEP